MKHTDAEIVLWLNQWIGQSRALDSFMELMVSDYFIPVLLALSLLGLWFSGTTSESRWRTQLGVITAIVALGFANLAVFVINDYYFRPRPFVEHDVTLLFYRPSDSSFPANPAALSFALAFGVWESHRPMGTVLLLLASLWNLARVSAGVFYPSDILVGALLGVTVAYLVRLGLHWLDPLPTLVIRIGRALRLA